MIDFGIKDIVDILIVALLLYYSCVPADEEERHAVALLRSARLHPSCVGARLRNILT